ncbi:hypothetical protein G4B88_008547, partial [Cannabis sativa]
PIQTRRNLSHEVTTIEPTLKTSQVTKLTRYLTGRERIINEKKLSETRDVTKSTGYNSIKKIFRENKLFKFLKLTKACRNSTSEVFSSTIQLPKDVSHEEVLRENEAMEIWTVEDSVQQKRVDRYRAPDLLLNSSNYTASWFVGCISMELMNRKPLFQGKDHVHQMRLLTEAHQLIDLGFIRNEDDKRYIPQLPSFPRQQLGRAFAHVHPVLAIDLIEKILTFDPNRRITSNFSYSRLDFSNSNTKNERPVFAFSFDSDISVSYNAGNCCLELPFAAEWDLGGNGGLVIMAQIENEYGSYGNDKAYLHHLIRLAKYHLGDDIEELEKQLRREQFVEMLSFQ